MHLINSKDLLPKYEHGGYNPSAFSEFSIAGFLQQWNEKVVNRATGPSTISRVACRSAVSLFQNVVEF